jgi:hypothetical protein
MPPLFLFSLIFSRTYTHSITLIQDIHPSPFAEAPFHLLIASQLSGKNLRGAEQGLGPALYNKRCSTILATSHRYFRHSFYQNDIAVKLVQSWDVN